MSTEEPPRMEELASMLLGMRDPLARIELAASQLRRGGPARPTPDLLERILASVADLDGRLQEALGFARPPAGGAGARGDCGAAVAAVTRELAPVLTARGRRLDPPHLPEDAARGDAHLARRAALQLLRAGGAWVGRGGRLRIALVSEGARCGVRVSARHGGGTPPGCRDPFGAARRFARAEGAALDVALDEASAGSASATLWLPAGAAS